MNMLVLMFILNMDFFHGFQTHHLLPGTYSIFPIEVGDIYFYLKSDNTSGLTFTIRDQHIHSDPIIPENNKFYKIVGEEISFFSENYEFDINFLMTPRDHCSEYGFFITLDEYIQFSFNLTNIFNNACVFLHQPSRTFQIRINCLSGDSSARCLLYSNETLFHEDFPISIIANKSEHFSISDGFILKTSSSFGLSLNSTLHFIQGNPQSKNFSKCNINPIIRANADGIFQNNITTVCKCIDEEESIVIALVLISVLIFTFVIGFIAFRISRSNRETYKSDREEPSQKIDKYSSSVGLDPNPLISDYEV